MRRPLKSSSRAGFPLRSLREAGNVIEVPTFSPRGAARKLLLLPLRPKSVSRLSSRRSRRPRCFRKR